MTENGFFENEETREQEIYFRTPRYMEGYTNPSYQYDIETENHLNLMETKGKTWGTSSTCLHCEWLLEPGHYGSCMYGHDTVVERPKHHTGNGKPQGVFVGTLTMSPEWPTNEDEMVFAIKKIMKQKACPVKRYVWYLEYTDAGLPHIHFMYETQKGGRITCQTFERSWKWWDESIQVGRGHRGGYHKHCFSQDDYIDYISKDKGRHDFKW